MFTVADSDESLVAALVMVIPCMDKLTKVKTHPKAFNVPPQKVKSKLFAPVNRVIIILISDIVQTDQNLQLILCFVWLSVFFNSAAINITVARYSYPV